MSDPWPFCFFQFFNFSAFSLTPIFQFFGPPSLFFKIKCSQPQVSFEFFANRQSIGLRHTDRIIRTLRYIKAEQNCFKERTVPSIENIDSILSLSRLFVCALAYFDHFDFKKYNKKGKLRFLFSCLIAFWCGPYLHDRNFYFVFVLLVKM